MSKILIIGLDGGTFDLIRPWVEEGKLPNIGQLMRDGLHKELQSTLPPMTFPAWNAFMTGKNVGKHGVFDFMERKDGTYELEIMNAQHRKSETIWNIASRYNKKCASIGVPVTFPPEEINGIMISGFDAPYSDERIMYPSKLYNELKEHVGPYILSADFTHYLKKGEIEKALEEICLVIDRKAETAKYIFNLQLWDLFMIVFGETDVAIHHFWKYYDKNSPQRSASFAKKPEIDPIYRIYKHVDKKIGELLALATEDTIIIMMSDHGAGGTGDKFIYPNRFLENHGLLRFKNYTLNNYINKYLDKIKLPLLSILPKELKRKLLYNNKSRGLKWESNLRYSFIDWPHTKVYTDETPYFPNMRVNLKGREPEGVVEKSNYHDLINKTISLLENWTDPETDQKVVKKAYVKEEVYKGNYLDRLPDILISWNLDNGYSYMSRSSFRSKKGIAIERVQDKREFEKSNYMFKRSGTHRDNGIFIISGNEIDSSADIDSIKIIDIAPTILYLLDIPIPNDMDGKLILDCFKKDTRKKPVYNERKQSTYESKYHYTDDEVDEIKEKLKGLGYL